MKKNYFIIFFFLTLTNLTYAQKVIKMERINNTYQIPCKVNGIPMNFIFDTGASDVSISITEAKFLIKQGLLTQDDLIEKVEYQIANGDIIEGTTVNLKSIEIDNIILNNIRASIIDSQNAPLLLGQSAISKIGRYSISGDILTLLDYEPKNLTATSEIKKLIMSMLKH
jgi:clan AA aspartic protease (TIGR02281 family)